jgi:outer membrane protein OmpA-like peptidoglycan-associated protein
VERLERVWRTAAGVACAVVAGGLGVSPEAQAQATALPELSLERLQLNPGAADSLVADGAALLAPGALRLALTGHYEHLPLEYTRDDALQGAIVGRRVTAHLTAAWAPTAWLELGAQLPLVVHQGGDALEAFGVAPPSSPAVGDPQLQVRVAALRQASGAPLDLAVGLGAQLPVGARTALTREATLRPGLSVGRTLGSSLRAGAEAGLVLRRAVDFQGTPLTRTEVEAAALLHTLGDGLRGELALRAALPTDGERLSSELLGGARYPLGKHVEAYALAGVGLRRGLGTPTFRGLAGLALLLDTRAAAPLQKAAPVAEPAPAPDADGDGVPDAQDGCPTQPAPGAQQGCPAPREERPVREQAPVREETPVREEAPARAAAVATIERHLCLFETNRSDLSPACTAALDEIARTLQQHEDIRLVVVEGYADRNGPPAYNLALSRERAQAVRIYLLQHGVAPERLQSRGFGAERSGGSGPSAADRRVRLTVQDAELPTR